MDTEFLVDGFFSTWDLSLHPLWASIVSDEKSSIRHIILTLYVIRGFLFRLSKYYLYFSIV